jgi:kynurenine aminotransferase
LNNPHNPTGKNFTREELEQISSVLEEFPHIIVLSDEVYDFLVFDKKEHIPFASIGNNYQRTISLYSGGKMFSATGWRCGWAIARPDLLRLGCIIDNTVYSSSNGPV